MTQPAPYTRRAVLVAATVGMVGVGTVGLVACSDAAEEQARKDDPVRLESLRSERELIAAYDRAISERPDLAAALGGIRDQHRAHESSLAAGVVASTPAPSTSSPTGSSPAGTPSATAPAVSLDDLRELERTAAGQRSSACVRAGGSELASLLCLIGASEAQHVAELAGLS